MTDNIQYLPLDVEAMLQARQFANSTCGDCVGLTEQCPACQDLNETNATTEAWELVDEGNLQYRYTLSHVTEPSGHDWVSSVTRLLKPAIQLDGTLVEFRNEFAQPSTKLIDGLDEETILHLNLAELDDETQRAREVECPWCHLMTPKQFNDCKDCDKPLEHNVR